MRIRQLKTQPYQVVWEDMKRFTSQRDVNTIDEIWFVEHPPVYTQGQAGKSEHIINPGHIPIVQSDRGGQVTYHGPGQLVVYVLFDLKRRHLGVRNLVSKLEDKVIELLDHYHICAHKREKAPGVYVEQQKIASIGLRVRNHCTYHGIALNVSMDLSPFDNINPCGYQGLTMTQMSTFDPHLSMAEVNQRLADLFLNDFDAHDSCRGTHASL